MRAAVRALAPGARAGAEVDAAATEAGPAASAAGEAPDLAAQAPWDAAAGSAAGGAAGTAVGIAVAAADAAVGPAADPASDAGAAAWADDPGHPAAERGRAKDCSACPPAASPRADARPADVDAADAAAGTAAAEVAVALAGVAACRPEGRAADFAPEPAPVPASGAVPGAWADAVAAAGIPAAGETGPVQVPGLGAEHPAAVGADSRAARMDAGPAVAPQASPVLRDVLAGAGARAEVRADAPGLPERAKERSVRARRERRARSAWRHAMTAWLWRPSCSSRRELRAWRTAWPFWSSRRPWRAGARRAVGERRPFHRRNDAVWTWAWRICRRRTIWRAHACRADGKSSVVSILARDP